MARALVSHFRLPEARMIVSYREMEHAAGVELTAGPEYFIELNDRFRGHRKEAPRPITEIRPKLPVLVDAAVMKSLAKERDSRFQSAGEFASTLLEAASKRR